MFNDLSDPNPFVNDVTKILDDNGVLESEFLDLLNLQQGSLS